MTLTPVTLKQKLKGSTRSIKAALLDQSLVAGAGNIYADESLFVAGIAPFTPAGRLSLKQLEKLRDSLVHVWRSALASAEPPSATSVIWKG